MRRAIMAGVAVTALLALDRTAAVAQTATPASAVVAPATTGADPAPNPDLSADLPSGLSRADLDRSGSVSREEFVARAGKGFARLDRNHDGLVDAAEIDAEAARIAAAVKTRLQRGFQAADADHDGRETKAEYEAYAAARFARQDRDGNGRIDAADLALGAKRRADRQP